MAPPPVATAGSTWWVPNPVLTINVSASSTSPWSEAGWMMDSLNHGTWNLPAGNYRFTVGVKADAFDKTANPSIVAVEGGVFDGRQNDTQILFDANTRAQRRVRHMSADLDRVVAQLEKQGKVPGKPPELTPIYSSYAYGGRIGFGGCGGEDGFAGSNPKCNWTEYGRGDPFTDRMHKVNKLFCGYPGCMTNNDGRNITDIWDSSFPGPDGPSLYPYINDLNAIMNSGPCGHNASSDLAKALVKLQQTGQVRKTPSWPRSWANVSLL
jgi:hypothetical protein